MNATYYTSAVYDLPNAGAGNLNVGSMGWCWELGVASNEVQSINDTLKAEL
ncbi:hypothetical protein K525DRAFT_274014 [Schizophyllum commune Loenen D]|nr:hypothetical protein K525DRAFT_274014 [Schizophyllum commune Loenen D]